MAVGDALCGNGRFSTSLAGTAAGAILGLLSLWITPALSDESADVALGLSVFSALTAGGTVLAYELSSRSRPHARTAARVAAATGTLLTVRQSFSARSALPSAKSFPCSP